MLLRRTRAARTAPALQDLIGSLDARLRADLRGLPRSWIERGIRTRMRETGIITYEGYSDRLHLVADERARLSHAIMLAVTGFFRDRPAWKYLSAEILPTLVDPGQPLRVWSAGCASGAEACSLAISLAEALGRAPLRDRVALFATDIDEAALDQSRRADYERDEIRGLPRRLRRRYLQRTGPVFRLRDELREAITVLHHDLGIDPPLMSIDLIVCRQTLMYLAPEARAGVLRGFHEALNEGAFLFLESTDELTGFPDGFERTSPHHPIYRKRA